LKTAAYGADFGGKACKQTQIEWGFNSEKATLAEQQIVDSMNAHITAAIDMIWQSGSLPMDYMEFLQGKELSIVLEKADSFLFPGTDRQSQDFFNTAAKSLAVAVAIMSFSPGGVRFFGVEYESFF
jgi:hypothetical protein